MIFKEYRVRVPNLHLLNFGLFQGHKFLFIMKKKQKNNRYSITFCHNLRRNILIQRIALGHEGFPTRNRTVMHTLQIKLQIGVNKHNRACLFLDSYNAIDRLCYLSAKLTYKNWTKLYLLCSVQAFCFGFRASDPDSTSTLEKEQLRQKVSLYQISYVPLFKTNMAHYL